MNDNNLTDSIKRIVIDYYSQPQFQDRHSSAFYRFYDSYIKEVDVDVESKIVIITLHRKSKWGSKMGSMVGKKGKYILPLHTLIQEEHGEEWKVILEDENWKKLEYWKDRV
tara:strand:+ start:682 stop:1014 length:333 start_codon:yes stop_codon:yes gene_type:complete